jgi:hypothetical protein
LARRSVGFCAHALLCAALLRPGTARASSEAGLADLLSRASSNATSTWMVTPGRSAVTVAVRLRF